MHSNTQICSHTQTEDTLDLKIIEYRDHFLKIYGHTGDFYLNDIDTAIKTNEFLLYIINYYINNQIYGLEIGANIGLTTAILGKSFPGSSFLSFEPDPQTFGFLQETIVANNLSNCTPYQLALGDRAGELTFMSDPNDSSGNRLAPSGTALGGGNRTMKVDRLDDFLIQEGFPKVDFIKLDVEGYEMEVLRGATKTLHTFRPSVYLEFNSFTLIAFGNHNPRELLDYLRQNFPYVYRFKEVTPLPIQNNQDEMDFIHTNLVHHGCVDDLYCTHTPIIA